MVELRWVFLGRDRATSLPLGAFPFDEGRQGFRVLQYRVLIPGVEVYGPAGRPPRWSEWKDVPIGEIAPEAEGLDE